MQTVQQNHSNQCLVCETPTVFWKKKKGREVSRCLKCGHVCVPSGLYLDDQGKTVYEGDQPIFLDPIKSAYYLDQTNFDSASLKKNIVKKFVPYNSTLLDVGANFGHFLKTLGKDYNAEGVELSSSAVAWGQKELGVKLREGSIYNLSHLYPHQTFDAVTAWDVVEHLDDPISGLNEMDKLLTPEGYMFLSTPNLSSLLAKTLKIRWHHIDPIQHINLFSLKNLSSLLEKKWNYKIVHTQSLGHYYRMRYALTKSLSILGMGLEQKLDFEKNYFLKKIGNQIVYLKLFDVMMIVAKKPKNR